MLTRRRFLALTAGGAALATTAAVGYRALPGAEAATGDPVIKYGAEPCHHCGMIISDERFAAAWRTAKGSERHFDDAGCMASAYHAEAPGAGTRVWVRDFAGTGWLDATAASFLHVPGVKSPMGFDLVASTSADAARRAARASDDAQVMAWPDLPHDGQGRH